MCAIRLLCLCVDMIWLGVDSEVLSGLVTFDISGVCCARAVLAFEEEQRPLCRVGQGGQNEMIGWWISHTNWILLWKLLQHHSIAVLFCCYLVLVLYCILIGSALQIVRYGQCCTLILFFQCKISFGTSTCIVIDQDLAGANTKQSADCYQCLSDW